MASPLHHHHHQTLHPPSPAPPPAPAAPPPPPPAAKPFDLEVTIISAKHLKNVNWRRGNLHAYAVVYLDPSRRAATHPDESGGCKPVWNERLHLPFPSHLSPHDPSLLLSLDVFHSKPSDSPKPLVGSARSPLRDLLAASAASSVITFDLLRPSGRPQGKLRIRLALRDRPPPPPPSEPTAAAFPQYPPPSSSSYYYAAAAPHLYSAPPQPPQFASTAGYTDSYYQPPSVPPFYSSAPPAAPYYEYTGPSAPAAEYNRRPASYDCDQRGKASASGRYGVGTGLAVGAVTGALGGMTIDEGVKCKEEKAAERDGAVRDDYSERRADY